MKATDYIAKRIKKETPIIFGVIGGAIMNLFDSLDKQGLNLITAHHEQGASMMADAYARVSGKLGVCIVTSGPGATNALTGTCCSYYDSINTLTIAGQVPTKNLKFGKLRQRGFQETDTISLFKSITKFSKQMKNPKEVEKDLEKAIQIAKTPRKGTTFLDLCDDVQISQIKGKQPKIKKETLPKAKRKDIQKLVKLINSSERPLLIIGAGAKYLKNHSIMQKSIKTLVYRLGIPTFLTWGAMDLLPHNNPLNCRDFGVTSQRIGNFAIKNADLIICLGTRLDTHEAVGNWTDAKVVMIDIDKAELNKQKAYLKIHSELSYFIKELKKSYIANWWGKWLNKIQYLRKKYPLPNTMPYKFIDRLSDYSKEGDIIITDAGQTLTWTMQAWKVKENQQLFSAFNHSPMGYAIPASIGAWYGVNPYKKSSEQLKNLKQVICITGDGGFQMNLQELQTIKGNDLPIKIFILDNKGYGMIKQGQADWPKFIKYGTACEPFMADFRKVAKCFGFKYEEILNDKQFHKIKKVLNYNSPVLCRIKIPEGTKIEPKLFFGNSYDNLRPYLKEDERNKINYILKNGIEYGIE